MEVKLKIIASKNIKANVALSIYFIFFIAYLYFFRIEKNIDVAFLFKPFIIPSIAFAYFFLTKNPFYFFNLFLFLIIYFADNLTLLEERNLYVFSTYLYLVVVAILFHYVVIDSEIFNQKPILKRIYPYFLFALLSSVFVIKIYSYITEEPFKEVYLIGTYVFLFLFLFCLTVYNVFKHKTKSALFLVATILCLFLSDTIMAMNNYYIKNISLIYLACLVEIPVYFFLMNYLLHREETIIQ